MKLISREDGTSYDYKVSAKVESFIDKGYTDITIKKREDGWTITAFKEVEDDED
ncbi:hypothetical protein [Paenibacillus harenae]|uniref:hypothetical protein n=1 Tax=Paenibacillus harenae TaxID=306543 RepID=UPI00040A74EC|nr:hypothetical protein [Paenibacillus harenae]